MIYSRPYYNGRPVTINFVQALDVESAQILMTKFSEMPESVFPKFAETISQTITHENPEFQKVMASAVTYEMWEHFKKIQKLHAEAMGLTVQQYDSMVSAKATEKAADKVMDRNLRYMIGDMMVDVRLDIETRYRKLTKLADRNKELEREGGLKLLLDSGEYKVADGVVKMYEFLEQYSKDLNTPTITKRGG